MRLDSSFRDPAGFVFQVDGVVRRQVSLAGKPAYDALVTTGLYDELVDERLLVSHRETLSSESWGPECFRIIEPERIPFVTYPYEWCFSQLRDAALLTLEIQERALARGVTLKDASAYNVQFVDGHPVFIDTLSFEPYEPGSPWIAYRQFCQHFLAPLLLMSLVDVRLLGLLRVHLDGIPLDLASGLLPRRSWLRPTTLLHVHLHARSLRRHANTHLNTLPANVSVSMTAMRGLIDSLRSAVSSLQWMPVGTEWADYTESNRYSPEAEAEKANLVDSYIRTITPGVVWDLGANTGSYSRIAAHRGWRVLSFDVDPAAVEKNYRLVKEHRDERILPLLLDLTNPSAGLGWANGERMAWVDRGMPDAILALALVHHLAIANNVPLPMVAEFFAGIASILVIEFVPKADSQVQRLIGSRKDIFPDYTQDGFEGAFQEFFEIIESDPIPSSERWLYLMRRK